MAVTINLYKFTKKLNSTTTPAITVTPDVYNCVFLDAQSIMNPVIEIEDTESKNTEMMQYTYAYIPTLSRYYFISNIVLVDNIRYTYYLQVDVLGSFKEDILNSRQYILRSTNHYNDYLIDNVYPTVPMPIGSRFDKSEYLANYLSAYDNKNGTWSSIDYFNQDYINGAILFGVTGQGNVSVDHYVATVNNFKTFINSVVTTTPTGQSWGNLPTGVQVALSNFLQYITFVKWIPFYPLSNNVGSAVNSIYLGDQSFSITAYSVSAGLNNQPLKFSLSVPEHPLTSTHKYYNFSPFREVNLFYLPIGNIPLDTTKLLRTNTDNPTRVYINMIVDLASGDTQYTVTVATSNADPKHGFTEMVLSNGVTNIGVDLSLTEYSMSMEAALVSGVSHFISKGIKQMESGISTASGGGSTTHTSSSGSTHGGKGGIVPIPRGGVKPYTKDFNTMVEDAATRNKEMISNVAKGVYDAIGNVLHLNMANTADMLGNFSDFVASSFGQVSTNGHTGSFLLSVATTPVIYSWFMKHGDEDYARFGRPYCAITRLDNISGYCQTKNANVSYILSHPLKPEIEAVNSLLNTGIYIEEF